MIPAGNKFDIFVVSSSGSLTNPVGEERVVVRERMK
jgi:hypothetical protein